MISIIIPCIREPYLENLIDDIHSNLTLSHEIRVQREAGLSNAVLHGVKGSAGDVIVVLDADGSHNPKYISGMVEKLSSCDIVVGSRYVEGGGTEDYTIRRLISRLFCKISRTLLSLDVNDTMSGFIAAKKPVFERLQLKPLGYKFGLEIMVKSKGCLRICEYPVVFEKRKMGHSKTGILQGIKTFTFIIKLWMSRTSPQI